MKSARAADHQCESLRRMQLETLRRCAFEPLGVGVPTQIAAFFQAWAVGRPVHLLQPPPLRSALSHEWLLLRLLLRPYRPLQSRRSRCSNLQLHIHWLHTLRNSLEIVRKSETTLAHPWGCRYTLMSSLPGFGC